MGSSYHEGIKANIDASCIDRGVSLNPELWMRTRRCCKMNVTSRRIEDREIDESRLQLSV